jgi:hypothetical protein
VEAMERVVDVIYFDYLSFKQFASKQNYQQVVKHIIETIQQVLTIYPTFEIHVNLFSFNTSSLAKHQEFLRIFANYSNMFGNKLTHFYVYYTPSIMDTIIQLFSRHIFHANTHTPEFIMYPKHDSEKALQKTVSGVC